MRQTNLFRFLYPRRQNGQALIYGIFVLAGGLVALFFLFNTGQLSSEKTKLVNTADAVAYSAGVMHARALNFDAYSNRALMANEVMIAQMVSTSSWVQYAQEHLDAVPVLNCYDQFAVPIALVLLKYTPLCFAFGYGYEVSQPLVAGANIAVGIGAPSVVKLSELAKSALQLAQSSMFLAFLPARKDLMQEVANANYLNDGLVEVDAVLPQTLTDNYTLFDGGPFIKQRTGNDRTRFREAERSAARLDEFVADRSWHDQSPWPCLVPRGVADRSGGTDLIGFDEWRAADRASLRIESWHFSFFSSGCKTDITYSLGDGSQSAKKNAGSSSDWSYSGVPSFYELSDKALAYTPNNPDKDKQDPRLKFAVRLTRASSQARTSSGRSAIKPSGQMAIYQGKESKDVLAAVATSEVFFERSTARGDGQKELASLFNPYWQVHLIANSAADLAKAVALQTGVAP
jgi:hypothetical protein